jgi:hypothetical protein
MQFRTAILSVSTLVFFAGAAIAAHHYDADKQVTVSGTVKEVKWDKPYVKIHLNVKNEKGKSQDWELETAAPTVLESDGLTRTSVKKGDQITARGDQEVDGSEHMLVRSMTLAGGKAIAINRTQNSTTAAASPNSAAGPQVPETLPQTASNSAARPQVPQTLPKTASNVPVVGAIGLLAIGAATLLRLVRRLG